MENMSASIYRVTRTVLKLYFIYNFFIPNAQKSLWKCMKSVTSVIKRERAHTKPVDKSVVMNYKASIIQLKHMLGLCLRPLPR